MTRGKQRNHVTAQHVESNGIPGAFHGWQKVYEYDSQGRSYYRYMWGDGHAVYGQKYIPGGNTRSAVAYRRALEVNRWIHNGAAPADIVQLIDSWRSRS